MRPPHPWLSRRVHSTMPALSGVDVHELRERRQQAGARERRRRRKRGRNVRVAQEGVRQLGAQCRAAERQVLRIELVPVDRHLVRAAQREMIATGAHVGERKRHAGAQLALKVGRPLLHARRRTILIDKAGVSVQTGQGSPGIPGRLQDALREGVVKRHRRRCGGLLHEGVLRVADLPVVARRRAGRLIVERRPVDAVSGAQHRVGIERVDNTDAGRRLDLRRIALRRNESLSVVAVRGYCDRGVFERSGAVNCYAYIDLPIANGSW